MPNLLYDAPLVGRLYGAADATGIRAAIQAGCCGATDWQASYSSMASGMTNAITSERRGRLSTAAAN